MSSIKKLKEKVRRSANADRSRSAAFFLLIFPFAFEGGAPARNRTGIRGLEIRCSIHLSYGSEAGWDIIGELPELARNFLSL